jgi:hypothetical protein
MENLIDLSKLALSDAFGRQRVSEPTTLFDSQLQYNDQPLLWETVGTGTATHVAAKAAVQFDVDAGESILRQTRAYHRYQPGKSQLVLMTGVLGVAMPNVTKRIGYYDDDNGIYFELTAAGLGIVKRSNVTGSVVNTRIEQADWNLAHVIEDVDTLEHTVDPTKSQIFVIDLEWLGVGRVRAGFVINGLTFYVQEFNHANVTNVVYMRTANLPVRYEMISTATGAADDMYQICSTVVSEGGFREELGVPHAIGNGATGITVSSRRSVLAIRPKATFNSIVNRGTIVPEVASFFVTTAPAYYEIVYGGTLGGSPSWTSAGANSIVEYDAAGTTVTGGEVIDAGYIVTSGSGGTARGGSVAALLSKLPLVLDKAGANPLALHLVITGIGGNPVVHAAVTWRELY